MKLIVLLGVLWIGRAQADVRFDRAFVPSGTGWWCGDGSCERQQKACEHYDSHCKKQDVAYAFISSKIATVTPTAAECEATRKDFATRDPVSPCAAVGVVPTKRYKALEPGDGFWCFRVTMTDVPSSICHRRREVCQGAYNASKTFPGTSVQTSCVHRKTAWVYMMEIEGFRLDSGQYETQPHCVHDATYAIAPCREIR